MSGWYVTEEERERFRELREREGLSYEKIAKRVGRSKAAVYRHITGRVVIPAGLTPEQYTERQRKFREQQRRWKRAWRANPANHEKDLTSSRDWKARNKEHVREYDRNRNWDRRHKANGSPSPSEGKECGCPAPNTDEDGYCGFCGDQVKA